MGYSNSSILCYPSCLHNVVIHSIVLFFQSLADLIAYTPTHAQAAQIVEAIERAAPFLSREPLSIKELSQFREKYRDPTLSVLVASDNPADQDKTLEGPYRRVAPYPDPFDLEDPIHTYLPHDVPGG